MAVGLWGRLGVTAVVSLGLGAGLWAVLDAAGVDPGLGSGAAAGLAAVLVTLGAVWASRARETAARLPGRDGGVGSPRGWRWARRRGRCSGRAVTSAGRRLTFHPPAGSGPGPGGAGVTGPSGGGGGCRVGRRVVVGEIPQEPPAFQDRGELLEALMGPGRGAGSGGVRGDGDARGGQDAVGRGVRAAAAIEGWRVVAWMDASGP